jgi:hypothetical protein
MQSETPLQTSPSSQEVPFATAVFWQPRIGSHVSVVHTLPSSQFGAAPEAHVPPWHVSAPLQASPSEHDVPFATAACVQPVAGLQPSVVQALPSSQFGGVPTWHVPAWHVSAPLQASPSEHDVPFATVGFWQTPALQTSLVQGLLSLQSAATLHDWQPAIGVWLQPVTGLHASVVQALLSLQLSGVPDAQTPA